MRRLWLSGLLGLVVAGAVSIGAGESRVQAAGPAGPHGQPEPPMLGIHLSRDEAARAARSGAFKSSSPNLLYHSGGSIITSAIPVTPIFWGTSWATDTSDKTTGINTFYSGFTGSVAGSGAAHPAYASTNTEYGAPTAPPAVTGAITVASAIVTTDPAPSGAPSASSVLNEVAKALSDRGTSPAQNGYYPVYSDQPRGNAGYCAWHSAGYIGTTLVEFAFFFNLDNDPGCDVAATTSHSQGLESLGNVSGHELSETLTDPLGNAWYDRRGYENSDKCAWVFPNGSGSIQFSNSRWTIQGNWSNKAYNGGYGFANSSGQKGCID